MGTGIKYPPEEPGIAAQSQRWEEKSQPLLPAKWPQMPHLTWETLPSPPARSCGQDLQTGRKERRAHRRTGDRRALACTRRWVAVNVHWDMRTQGWPGQGRVFPEQHPQRTACQREISLRKTASSDKEWNSSYILSLVTISLLSCNLMFKSHSSTLKDFFKVKHKDFLVLIIV